MMKNQRFLQIAAVAVLIVSGAGLTVAAASPQRGPTTTDAAAKSGPVSRPVNSGALRAPQAGSIATPLTEAQCTGMGGVIRDENACADTKKSCWTADKDGVIRGMCISKD